MRALALFSGGLDSMLAMKTIANQGIDVIALHFDIGFVSTEKKLDKLKYYAELSGATLKIVDIKEQFFNEILFDPKYGYGKYFNPCIDCHANMFHHAHALMEELDAQFLISGEVLGQRPKSQRKEALGQVQKLSGADDLILRPLCARLLPPSKPELAGWVDREKLHAIEGRSRTEQMRLAKEFGFEEFEDPAGGCMLTETTIAEKIKDLMKHDSMTMEDIALLKLGRYMILPDGARLIISRNAEENGKIKNLENPKFIKMQLIDTIGPLCLLSKEANEADRLLAAQLNITYGKTQSGESYEVEIGDAIIKTESHLTKQDAQAYFLKY